MNITNKTGRPIRVPLPDGKQLFLGPRKTGQITARSAKHPPLLKLVEAGEVEVDDAGRKPDVGTSDGATPPSGNQTIGPKSSIRRTGER